MSALRKKGVDIQPVEIEGRKIAKTFWGEGWCDHLESFSDYANRLPRGRTYVRNGHLPSAVSGAPRPSLARNCTPSKYVKTLRRPRSGRH
jgi:hypothetical protein